MLSTQVVYALYSLVLFRKLKPVTGNFFSEFMFVQQRQTPNIAELVAYGVFRPQPYFLRQFQGKNSIQARGQVQRDEYRNY